MVERKTDLSLKQETTDCINETTLTYVKWWSAAITFTSPLYCPSHALCMYIDVIYNHHIHFQGQIPVAEQLRLSVWKEGSLISVWLSVFTQWSKWKSAFYFYFLRKNTPFIHLMLHTHVCRPTFIGMKRLYIFWPTPINNDSNNPRNWEPQVYSSHL